MRSTTNMDSPDAIALSISLCMKLVAYLIPVIPQFRTHSLVFKRIRYSHKTRYTDITHCPKRYILIPPRFKRYRYSFAVIEERDSCKNRREFLCKKAINEETFVKLIGRYFIHKIKRNGGFDFSKLLRKSKNDKQQF